MELFVFTNNLLFESVFYKGTSKSLLLFELVIRLHQVQIKGELILHILHIEGKRVEKSGIDGLSRGNNIGGGDERSGSFAIFPVGKRGY